MTTEPLYEKIDYSEIKIIHEVGSGSFGTVYQASWKDKSVAVKFIKQEQMIELNKEIHQLSRVDHLNIVRLYGVYIQKPHVCLVMEFADGGSLYNLLHCSPQIKYTTRHALSWVMQCALGVAHMHAMKPRPVIHRDLKSPNLLLVKGGTIIKICDFGTATEQRTLMTMNKGTIAYMAPEVFKGTEYTEKCDVYSWGIIVWEVFSRQKPFNELQSQFNIMYDVGQGKRPPLNKEYPESIENLITTCWDQSATNRPTMSDVVKQMLEIYKSFRSGIVPLAIQDPFDEEIDHHEIYKFNLLGKGTFGTVYKAMWKNKLVAVKYFEWDGPLHRFSHPHIVRLYGACTQALNACVVMEFCENSSLYNVLYSKAQIQYTTGHAMRWMKQCAEAVEFLHSMIPRPLIHRSLKSLNLLLVNKGTVLKIWVVPTTTKLNTPLIMDNTPITMDTIRYMAPEVYQGKEYNEKCNVYSWGIILWEIFSRQEPYNEFNNQFAIMDHVGMGNRPPLIEENPEQIRNLMTACWDQNAANRPSMSVVVKQMIELCKTFPGSVIPLAIRDPLVEEIDHREINEFSFVGKGTFSTVCKAVWKNQNVAVKYIEKSFPVTQISHPNIVRLYGICTQKPNVCLVMEFCDGVSLYAVLYSMPRIQYTLGHAMSWMKQCAEAFAFLHSMISRPLIHWKLKTQNLLLVNNGTLLKISEICTTKEDSLVATDDKIYPHLPIEAFEENDYPEKCDVYSWGILMRVILNHHKLNCDNNKKTIKKQYYDSIENLMTDCCDRNHANRPTMLDIVKKMIDVCKFEHCGGDTPLNIRHIGYEVTNYFDFAIKSWKIKPSPTSWPFDESYIKYRKKIYPSTVKFRQSHWISTINIKQRKTSLVPIIDRTSYMPESFEEFIHFLNTDDCKITDANGIQLLKLAIKFKVVKLENKVLNSLSSVTWCLKLFQFCVVEKYQMVRRHLDEIIAKNYARCLKNEYFTSLHLNAVHALLNYDHIQRDVTEVDIFNAMEHWINSSAAHRISLSEGRFDDLIKKIRFPTMEIEDCNRCMQIFPVQLNDNEAWKAIPRKHYEFPYAWRNGEHCEKFETVLRVLKRIILCGLRVGIENHRKPFRININQKCLWTAKTEDLVIEHNAYNYWDCVIISLGDPIVLEPGFEYKICIEYSEVIDEEMRVLCRKEGFPVAIDIEYNNSVLVTSSSANMLEMMFQYFSKVFDFIPFPSFKVFDITVKD